jgi:hypothetical protein
MNPDAAFYVESSLPPGMTIGEYRRSRPRRPTRWQRLKALARADQPARRSVETAGGVASAFRSSRDHGAWAASPS